jgi:hypothetical protein
MKNKLQIATNVKCEFEKFQVQSLKSFIIIFLENMNNNNKYIFFLFTFSL